MAAITSEFDLSFAPGWLDSVPMMETENTPKYHPSLTLPMVRLSAPQPPASTRR